MNKVKVRKQPDGNMYHWQFHIIEDNSFDKHLQKHTVNEHMKRKFSTSSVSKEIQINEVSLGSSKCDYYKNKSIKNFLAKRLKILLFHLNIVGGIHHRIYDSNISRKLAII